MALEAVVASFGDNGSSQHAAVEVAEVSEGHGSMAGCGSEEVLQRAALTSTSRACSRSASALTSRPAPSSVDAHASSGAFNLMNSHLSTSPKRAKSTGSSLSANLPITRMGGPSAAAACVRANWRRSTMGERHNRPGKPGGIVRTNEARRGSLQDDQPAQGYGERLNEML